MVRLAMGRPLLGYQIALEDMLATDEWIHPDPTV